MAQYRKTIFNLSSGPGEAIADPRAEELARQQQLALQAQQAQQQQRFQQQQLAQQAFNARMEHMLGMARESRAQQEFQASMPLKQQQLQADLARTNAMRDEALGRAELGRMELGLKRDFMPQEFGLKRDELAARLQEIQARTATEQGKLGLDRERLGLDRRRTESSIKRDAAQQTLAERDLALKETAQRDEIKNYAAKRDIDKAYQGDILELGARVELDTKTKLEGLKIAGQKELATFSRDLDADERKLDMDLKRANVALVGAKTDTERAQISDMLQKIELQREALQIKREALQQEKDARAAQIQHELNMIPLRGEEDRKTVAARGEVQKGLQDDSQEFQSGENALNRSAEAAKATQANQWRASEGAKDRTLASRRLANEENLTKIKLSAYEEERAARAQAAELKKVELLAPYVDEFRSRNMDKREQLELLARAANELGPDLAKALLQRMRSGYNQDLQREQWNTLMGVGLLTVPRGIRYGSVRPESLARESAPTDDDLVRILGSR